jgi:hypothetical protein
MHIKKKSKTNAQKEKELNFRTQEKTKKLKNAQKRNIKI